ncbi:hypothetical protein BFJ63_vAg14372 [Fusarium oxysporum f. sp. narcissi]|uniref:SnoaL-like domain-containing protein n=2 Tax=Fusarium oxysporum TaxID=5507 RepID=A0A4Q2V889_FUSOX|nr:hypothetical protein BFJ65_g18270 [Fusarium oxysporum f. sp. cepae]RKK84909.1 hypothetical protein BFJ71_g14346 [Fusarium oxysporum]RYC82750.1 hypothetical protein BFJ63_vAg14372 [Fusarium oxysporum f. sp. narcissi]RKK39684.1 hypothetical protein BFJ67_g11327 [Fusarium oxysporum f. sp. cepae]RKK42000.1 hypothetical protein BFJ66_g10691 [Fusarium oxysporum f. sp. cepae]
MHYSTEGAQWLSDSVSQHIKDLIATFYELADSRELDAGTRMATEVFTKDAVWITANGTFKGFTEISKSRDNAWSAVKSRKHCVLKVFLGNDGIPELSIIGTGEIEFHNGKKINSPFACYVKLDSLDSTASVRISFMQVIADTAPISAMLAK